jgi:glycosyltransferase involved in cell wall biosynthesis
MRGLVFAETRLRRAAARDAVVVFFAPAYSCPLTLRRPRVTAIHDLSFFALPAEYSPRDRLRRRLLARASVRASTRILTISDFSRRELLRLFPRAAGRVVTIPLGPDDDLPEAQPREEARQALAVAGPLVLTVGAILNRRRLPELLAAFALIRKRLPLARLEVVGENRTQPRLDLEAEVARLGLTGHAFLRGFLDENALALRYAAADLCVVLSDYEGFGLPALEALSRGVPLVTSHRPALSELFGEAALLVDPTDPAAGAMACLRVLEDPALANELRGKGHTLATRFSWAETARRTWTCLEEAAGA